MQTILTTDPMLHNFRHYDLIPLKQDSLWLIEEGVVRTFTWNEEGTVVTLGYWGIGDVVGQPLFDLQPYQIECLTSVEVRCIPLNQSSPLLEAICRHIQQTQELLCIVRSERIPQRLQQFLVWLARKFGREVAQGQLINLRLTHQELAEGIGTTRVTVTRQLKQFEQEGIISRPQRNFIVLRDSVQALGSHV